MTAPKAKKGRAKKCMFWDDPSYTMVALDCVLAFEFSKSPKLAPVPLHLPGGTINPGDKINGLFGPCTSSQYENFHPIAPGHVVYEGIFDDLWRTIVIGTWPGKTEHEGKVVKYGWILPEKVEGVQYLFSILRGGSIRTVQCEWIFLNDEMPPKECLDDKYYWKKKAKAEKAKGEA